MMPLPVYWRPDLRFRGDLVRVEIRDDAGRVRDAYLAEPGNLLPPSAPIGVRLHIIGRSGPGVRGWSWRLPRTSCRSG